MKLQKIGPDSANVLSELSIATFMQAYEDVHSPNNLNIYCQQHYSTSAIARLLNDKAVQSVVAFDEQETGRRKSAGFYVLKHHDCPVPQTGQGTELKQIYVLSDYYGIGLGAELFERAVQQARQHQSDWLWLCVSHKNHRAQAFYQKLGFERVGNGPALTVGSDSLTSSIMLLRL